MTYIFKRFYITMMVRSPALSPDLMLAKAEEVSFLMRVLSHPQRLCLLCHLSGGARTVGELVELCAIPQPQVSQFLARMKLEKLVKATRNGRFIVYEIADERALKVVQSLSDIFCHKD